MARREKKPVHRVEMTEGKRNIIRQLLQEIYGHITLLAAEILTTETAAIRTNFGRTKKPTTQFT